MPALAFLALAGLALVALMLIADATLEKGAPSIVTSSRVGLPERWHSDDVQIFTTTLTPSPTQHRRRCALQLESQFVSSTRFAISLSMRSNLLPERINQRYILKFAMR